MTNHEHSWIKSHNATQVCVTCRERKLTSDWVWDGDEITFALNRAGITRGGQLMNAILTQLTEQRRIK